MVHIEKNVFRKVWGKFCRRWERELNNRANSPANIRDYKFFGNSLCSLKKKKMKNLYKKVETYKVNVLHEPQFPAENFKILSWTWSPEVHKMCPKGTAHRFAQRTPRWEGQAQRGEAWGGTSHPHHRPV